MIERLTNPSDAKEVWAVMKSPDVWEHITDDAPVWMGEGELSMVVANPSLFFLVPVVDGIRVGVFFLHPWNYVTYELHSMVRKENRGKMVVAGLKELGRFMFDNTPCQKIVTHVPAGNFRAKALAQLMGMELIGNNRKSLLRGGVLIDQYLYGICKQRGEEICQRHR